MAWLRLDDGFPQHPKLDGWTSAQKWALVELFAYCARHRTEGHVPSDLSLLPRGVTTKVIMLAEDCGILERSEQGDLTVHDWNVYNPSDATAAERMKRMRERNASRNAKRNEGSNADRNAAVTSRARLPSRPSEDEEPEPSLLEPNPPTHPELQDALGGRVDREIGLERLSPDVIVRQLREQEAAT